MDKKSLWIIGIVMVVVVIGGIYFSNQTQNESIKIGFIGALTGSAAKQGSFEAANLAVEEINSAGGINGKRVDFIVEDTKCNAAEAVTAANKLISLDNVEVILGGHCTPESIAIAPIVEENKVIMLASVTTTPALTNMGDYVFRTSPVSVVQSEMVANALYNELSRRKLAVVYEQTDYTRPIAEKIRDEFKELGGEVLLFEAYTSENTDFRTILLKAETEEVDAIFLSSLTPDSIINFMKQFKELGLDEKGIQFSGNEQISTQAAIGSVPDGAILAVPNFDVSNAKTQEFINDYNSKYGTNGLPYGFFTAESYDAVYIIKMCIEEYGEDAEDIRKCLSELKDFEGVSGSISLDSNGDGIRVYSLKEIRNGILTDYSN